MAKKRRKGNQGVVVRDEQLPEGCHHYTDRAEVPEDIQKYALQNQVLRMLMLYLDILLNDTASSPDMMKGYG